MTARRTFQLSLEHPVQDAGFSSDSQSLWSVDVDLVARRWNIDAGSEEASVDARQPPEESRFVSPDWNWATARSRGKLSTCGRYFLALFRVADPEAVFSRVFALDTHELLAVNHGLCWFSELPDMLIEGHANVVPLECDVANIQASSNGHLVSLQDFGHLYELAFLPQNHGRFCLSPDGRRVASWQGWKEHNVYVPPRANEVSVWDVPDQSRTFRLEYSDTRTLVGHQDAIDSALFLPGALPRLLTTSKHESWGNVGDECNALIWNYETGEPVLSLESAKGSAMLPTPTPDGALILSVTEWDTVRDPFVRGFDAMTGQELFQSESHATRSLPTHECGVDLLAVSPDSRHMATLCRNTGCVHITSLASGSLVDSLTVENTTRNPNANGLIRFSPDSRKLLVTLRHDHVDVYQVAG